VAVEEEGEGEIFDFLNAVHLARLLQDAPFTAQDFVFRKPGKQSEPARLFSYQMFGI
jgi:hypothetical protein